MVSLHLPDPRTRNWLASRVRFGIYLRTHQPRSNRLPCRDGRHGPNKRAGLKRACFSLTRGQNRSRSMRKQPPRRLVPYRCKNRHALGSTDASGRTPARATETTGPNTLLETRVISNRAARGKSRHLPPSSPSHWMDSNSGHAQTQQTVGHSLGPGRPLPTRTIVRNPDDAVAEAYAWKRTHFRRSLLALAYFEIYCQAVVSGDESPGEVEVQVMSSPCLIGSGNTEVRTAIKAGQSVASLSDENNGMGNFKVHTVPSSD